ncbi:MAG: DUF6134 family protein [Pseudomonadales bacterium]
MPTRSIQPLVLSALLAMSSALAASTETTEHLRFDIEFDGKRLGQHEFQVTQQENGKTKVVSIVEMRYRLAFVTLFRYQHSATEQWRDGCLTTLSSTTNDDGERYAVEGAQTSEGFVVKHRLPKSEQERIAETCPASFAYWQPEALQRSALINAQTGRLEPVQVARTGTRQLGDVTTEHWTIETENEGTIELWYAASDGRWLQLQHTSEDGVLLYQRSDS